MSNHEAALQKFIEDLLKRESEYTPGTARSWVYGAVAFAFSSGQIDHYTLDRLLEEYGIIQK